MTAETRMRGHLEYLRMLNEGEIENGLGGEIQKAKKRKTRNDWGRPNLPKGKKPNPAADYRIVHRGDKEW